MVLKQDGSVWVAGRNCNGQLGDGSKTDRGSFVKVISGGAADVAAGGHHSMVLNEDGSVWATGWNEYGQLGDGTTTERLNYVQVLLNGAESIAAGNRHSMVLMQNGTVWATGHNRYGQLGGGSTDSSKTFVQVIVIADGVKAIAAGAFHSMILKQDDSIWATGSNAHGQLGDDLTSFKIFYSRLAQFGTGAGHETIIFTWFAVIGKPLYHLTTKFI